MPSGSDPTDADVVSRFLAHAAARRDAPAVVEDGGILTYGQLDAASAALASSLLPQYAGDRDSAPIVAVLLPVARRLWSPPSASSVPAPHIFRWNHVILTTGSV